MKTVQAFADSRGELHRSELDARRADFWSAEEAVKDAIKRRGPLRVVPGDVEAVLRSVGPDLLRKYADATDAYMLAQVRGAL